jgi:hypothetical protein
MRIRSAVLSMLLGLGLAVGGGGVIGFGVTPASAAQGYTETGATTYALDPARGALHVSVTLRIANTTPSTTSAAGTMVWFLRTATIWVEDEATAIRATSGGIRLAAALGDIGPWYRPLTVTFPKLYYGQSRTITVTYDIHGGAPRSASPLRVLRAYASFCAIANGVDSGSVRVSVPAGFGLETTGTPLTSSIVAGQRTYTSGRIADTASFWTCFSGTNTAGYQTAQLAAPDGRAIRLESWPEDQRWAQAVTGEIAKGVPALVRLIGRPMPGTAPIVVLEQATGSEYAGFYDASTNTVTVGEDYGQAGLVEHELAHVWFNFSAFADRWLDEGSAEWAARSTSGRQAACAKPAAGTRITLADWQFLNPKSSRSDRAAVDLEYETACYIVTAVDAAAGPGGMTAALGALLAGRDPYSSDPNARRATTVATWRDWLDAMDELALGPAGAPTNLATDMFLAYGVTSDGTILAQRTVARAAYHRLLAEVEGWSVPPAIRAPMGTWDFAAANAAISAAGLAWTLTGETDQALPGIDARHGPVAAAWAAATTVTEITNAGKLALAQLDGAKAVAATIALVQAPLDAIGQVGLVGGSLPSLEPAVAAVRSGDSTTARRLAAAARDELAGIQTAGLQRVLIAIAVGLLALLMLVLRLGRRGRRPPSPAPELAAAASSPGDPRSSPGDPTSSPLDPPPAPWDPPTSPSPGPPWPGQPSG